MNGYKKITSKSHSFLWCTSQHGVFFTYTRRMDVNKIQSFLLVEPQVDEYVSGVFFLFVFDDSSLLDQSVAAVESKIRLYLKKTNIKIKHFISTPSTCVDEYLSILSHTYTRGTHAFSLSLRMYLSNNRKNINKININRHDNKILPTILCHSDFVLGIKVARNLIFRFIAGICYCYDWTIILFIFLLPLEHIS